MRITSEFLLIIASLLAVVLANSPLSISYHEYFQATLSFFGANFSLNFVINDFLMAIFFLLVGLELKREILVGELSSKDRIALPTLGAVGGTIFPALIFCSINFYHAENLRGFAIPTATDIVFTYLVIKIFGDKISSAAKVFLITLAVVDDIIAILIIAFFYTENLQIIYLFAALLVVIALFFINLKKSESLIFYVIFGAILWYFILQSGVHPSVAGVILAMFIPFKTSNNFPLKKVAENIAPIVNFLILPLFAFANMGINISNISLEILQDKIVLGIAMGLFAGKQLGVMLFSFILIKLKLCHLPKGSNWLEFYALAILTGIGFTMSLFVGNLAFSEEDLMNRVKVGILLGSFVSAAVGSLILLFHNKKITKTKNAN